MPNDLFRFRLDVAGAGLISFNPKKLRDVLRQSGREVATATRMMIRTSAGGGRLYTIRRAGAIELHQASAPGQPPANLSGALAKSINVRVFRSGLGVTIRDTMFYMLFLEKGARGGGRGRRNAVTRRGGARTVIANGPRVLLPRPALTAAIALKQQSIRARMEAAAVGGIEWQKAP